MTQHREEYIDLMSDAFVAGLAPVDGVLDPREEPRGNMYAAMDLVMPNIAVVDWEERAVNPPAAYAEDMDIDEYERSRAGHAERLVSAAFTDAVFLFDHAQYALKRQQVYGVDSFGRILLNSERTLLLASRMDDPHKEQLFMAMKLGSNVGKVLIDRNYAEEPLVVRHDTSGQPLVDWRPPVAGWIRDQVRSGGGCPAHRKVIEMGGRKMTLMHFFWDKLVRAAYEV